jgi:hypothetical protein
MPLDLLSSDLAPATRALSAMGVECVVCDENGQPARRKMFRLSLLLSKLGLA